MPKGTCGVEGCSAPASAKDMCPMHYRRQRMGRDLHAPKAHQQSKTCVINECGRPTVARSMCGMHYRRWNLYGDPRAGGPFMDVPPARLCSIQGCGIKHYARGLCIGHHNRKQKYGDPMAGRASRRLAIPPSPSLCSVEGCEQAAKSDGMCWSHLNRLRYAQNPDAWKRWAADYRARRLFAHVESFDKAEIFDRDAWTCGLCKEPINPSLSWPHPESASLDHIVPLSRGGEHSKANAQSAHLGCNVSKNNRPQGEQLRLLG